MRHPQGLFGWVDLVTTDVDAAKAFYAGLFGWDFEDMPTPMGPAYTMCSKDGEQVAGIGPQPPGMAQQGVPSMWNSYVIVADADAICAAAEAAGGSVAMPAMDVMTQGRMAFIGDPSGAVCGIWQPGDHEGATLFNVPGSLVWNELQTRDLEAAKPFYSEVFGWRWDDADQDGYFMIVLDAKDGDDKSNGGAMAMPPGVPDAVPSFWAVYFAVQDCAASVATAEALGGTVFLAPMQMGPGTFAGVTDPTGGMFFLGNFSG